MNQILSTKINKKTPKKLLKLQLFLSNFIIVLILIYFFFNSSILLKQEKKSRQLINNFNISKLYDNSIDNIFGIIKIPNINICYPIFSSFDTELLKVSPCKFYGGTPNNLGNICIAGHNYNNNLFFSNISLLKFQNEIFLFDNKGQQYIYYVFSIYEVDSSNLSPVLEYSQTERILTLITCNNLNNRRIIVKAKQKDF